MFFVYYSLLHLFSLAVLCAQNKLSKFYSLSMFSSLCFYFKLLINRAKYSVLRQKPFQRLLCRSQVEMDCMNFKKHFIRTFSVEKDPLYVCSSCGKQYSKWQGQCFSCHAWNTIKQAERSQSPTNKSVSATKQVSPAKLSEITSITHSRYCLKGTELNRVLGGGIVPGSIVLIGGEPGIGKSTLLLEISSDICMINKLNVLYVSGEESEDQVKLRCDRLGIRTDRLSLLHETNLDAVLEYVYQHVLPPPLVCSSRKTSPQS